MNWQRFLSGVALGLVSSIVIACTQVATEAPSPSAAPAEPVANSVDTSATVSPEATMPPATQELLASLGQEPVNPPRGDLRMVVISDLNGAYGSTDYDPEIDQTIALMPFWNPDLVLCSGDMVAGQDRSLAPDQIQAMWAAFDEHVAAPLREAGLPYGFTMGNHDASGALGMNDQPLFQQERDLASAYWQEPQHDPGVEFIDRSEYPFYYTFRQNDVFFLVLGWLHQSDACGQAGLGRASPRE